MPLKINGIPYTDPVGTMLPRLPAPNRENSVKSDSQNL